MAIQQERHGRDILSCAADAALLDCFASLAMTVVVPRYSLKHHHNPLFCLFLASIVMELSHTAPRVCGII